MNRKTIIRALLARQRAASRRPPRWRRSRPRPQPEPTEPDPSDATADAAIAEAAPVDDAQAKIELLQAQVEALQEALEGVKAAMAKVTPSWKGAPLFEDKEDGWSFKPRGRLQYDVGYVGNPGRCRVVTRNLGFNTRARRIRLGAEGTIPGGFGYKFEMDFANASVGFGDVILTYAPKNKPYQLRDRQPRDHQRPRADHQLALLQLHRARRVRRRVHQHPPHRYLGGLCQQGRRLPLQRRPVRRPLDRRAASTTTAGSARRARSTRR